MSTIKQTFHEISSNTCMRLRSVPHGVQLIALHITIAINTLFQNFHENISAMILHVYTYIYTQSNCKDVGLNTQKTVAYCTDGT